MIRLIDFMRAQQLDVPVVVTAMALQTSDDDFDAIAAIVVRHGGGPGFEVVEGVRSQGDHYTAFIATRTT